MASISRVVKKSGSGGHKSTYKSPVAISTLLALGAVGLGVFAALPSGSYAHQAGGSTPSTVLADPADWPMYGHDAQRTSFDPNETVLSSSNVAGMTQLWQHFIDSNGTPSSSGPVVSAGKVFVGSSVNSNKNYFAFGSTTGVTSWTVNVGHVEANCTNVGLGSTAAISGTVLAVGGGDSAYYGLDTGDGHQLWRNTMNVGSSGFAWVSPLLVNGRAYVGMASRCDNPSVRGEVRSVNMTDGSNPLSQYFVPSGQAGGGIWNSPALDPGGTKLYVVTGEDYNGYNGIYNRAMVALDPNTLSVLSSYQEGATGQDLDFGTTPVVYSDSQGRTLVGAEHKNGNFYAYDTANIAAGPVYTKTLSGSAVGMLPAYDPTHGQGGTLFAASASSSVIYAMDPATGVTRWTSSALGSIHGNMAVANGLIYINVSSTGLKVLDENNGQILATITPANVGASFSGPAISHGVVYFVSGSYLNAWSVPAALTPTPTSVAFSTPTSTLISTPTPIASSTPTPVATPSGPQHFEDIRPGSTFYTWIECLATRNIVSGYPCGSNGEACGPTSLPYFRPVNSISRGEIAKIVAGAAGLNSDPGAQLFEDVEPGSPFYLWINRLAQAGVMSGYTCGGPGEPCIDGNLPYFRPAANASRGQLSKIVSNAEGYADTPTGQTYEDVLPTAVFYLWIERLTAHNVMGGYTCGSIGEPCNPANPRPYFRSENDVTRGEASKIVSNTFFPECNIK